MQKEGELLKAFMEQNSKSVAAMARALGKSRQTIYQYFTTEAFDAATKATIEKHLGKEVFKTVSNKNDTVVLTRKIDQAQEYNPQLHFNAHLALINENMDYLKKEIRDQLTRIEANLKTVTDNIDYIVLQNHNQNNSGKTHIANLNDLEKILDKGDGSFRKSVELLLKKKRDVRDQTKNH